MHWLVLIPQPKTSLLESESCLSANSSYWDPFQSRRHLHSQAFRFIDLTVRLQQAAFITEFVEALSIEASATLSGCFYQGHSNKAECITVVIDKDAVDGELVSSESQWLLSKQCDAGLLEKQEQKEANLLEFGASSRLKG